jgi:hypothetical protein
MGPKRLEKWFGIVYDRSLGWDVVTETFATGERKTMYDITVPDTWTFTTAGGAVVWDTMAVYLPLTETARQEALDKMLPSKNLFSSTNYGIMHAPDHESIIGLNMLSKWGTSSGAKFSSLEDLKKSNKPLYEGFAKHARAKMEEVRAEHPEVIAPLASLLARCGVHKVEEHVLHELIEYEMITPKVHAALRQSMEAEAHEGK